MEVAHNEEEADIQPPPADPSPAAAAVGLRRRLGGRIADRERITRLYRLVNRASAMMVRASSRRALFESLCSLAAESGLFSAIWVALAQGGDPRERRQMCYCRESTPACFSPAFMREVAAATAADARRELVHNDLDAAPAAQPWLAEARLNGHRAFASIPLLEREGPAGRVMVFSSEPDFFDGETLSLFRQLADNVSFVLHAIDEAELRRLSQERLDQSRRDMASLLDHLQAVREDERALIARELHDELGQALTALKMDLAALETGIGPAGPRQAGRVRRMKALVSQAIDEVHRIVGAMRPRILDDLGLGPALEWLAGEFRERSGIDCRVDIGLATAQLPDAIATTAFRCVQESLTNVLRHAAASAVTIRLWRDGEGLGLSVSDNGRGLAAARENAFAGGNTGGFGLRGLRQRAEALGGSFRIDSRSRVGTTIEIRLPPGRAGAATSGPAEIRS